MRRFRRVFAASEFEFRVACGKNWRTLIAMRSFALLLAASVVACSAGAPSERTASLSSPIQGGTTDTTHNFVVAVVEQVSQGFGLCSGSLLAPNLVATARHCVAQVVSQPIDCTLSSFGDTVPASELEVTNVPDLANVTQGTAVQQIIVPSGAGTTSFCGNDLALLILAQPITVPEYVTPVIDPPMTDHSLYSTTITAIGYGIDSPLDTTGQTAGIRRIREDIDLVCVPNDVTVPDCLATPGASEFISANEFEATDGVCSGDSGSGAFEQRSFNAGIWTSFGVVSRGTTDGDGGMCVNSIYTQFSAWGSLLAEAAAQAAQIGGYPTPAWALAIGSEGGVPPEGGQPVAPSCLSSGAACGADTDCCSDNCISHDNAATFLCADCNADNPCDVGYQCNQGTCVFGSGSDGGEGLPSSTRASTTVNAVSSGGGAAASSSGQGCSVGAGASRRRAGGSIGLTAFVIGCLLRRRLPQRVRRRPGRGRIA
jgi:trypsin